MHYLQWVHSIEIQGGRIAIVLTITQRYLPQCSLHKNKIDTCEQNDTSHIPTHERHLHMLCNTHDVWCTQHCHMNLFIIPCGSPVGTKRQHSLRTGEFAELSLLSMALSTILKAIPQGVHPDCRVCSDRGVREYHWTILTKRFLMPLLHSVRHSTSSLPRLVQRQL